MFAKCQKIDVCTDQACTLSCFKGYKLSRPYASVLGFAHVLDLSTLDKGLVLYSAAVRGEKRERNNEQQ